MELKYNTILLIHVGEEDGGKFISRFMDFFEEKGFTIIHVETIRQGYEVLGSQSVDIIVLDMDENYKEAFRFCYRVKKNKNLERILIVGLSAAHQKYNIFLEARTPEERKWLNVDIFVHKPIFAKNLYRLLKKEIAILEGIDATILDNEKDMNL